MAGRTRNRLDLRRQAEAAELRGLTPADSSRGAPKSRSSRAGANANVAVRACWGVFDGAMKRIQTFPFQQKAQAEQCVADLNERRVNGTTYFLQLVKEPVDGSDDG